MIITMRSLFLKIFLWFWITVIATGVALAVTWILLQPKNALSQLQAILADAAWASGAATVNELEQHGASAASVYMQQFSQKSHLKTCLFDITGKAISGSDCSVFNGVVSPPQFRRARLQSQARRRPSVCEGAGKQWPPVHLCRCSR